jgi:type IV secretory pathway TrbD component
LLDQGKETIATSALDAQPDMILEMPEDSYAPVVLTAGLSVLFVGLLLRNWIAVGVGAVIVAGGILAWLWPSRELREREPEVAHG